jgi:uncharacterized alpha-E superfamily protein
MTSRQIDVGAFRLLKRVDGDVPSPYEGLLWTSILRSQSGFQMYRQHVKRRINGVDVVRFLLQDIPFPRAVAHALHYVQGAIERLPRNEVPLRLVMQARRHVLGAEVEHLITEDRLHDYIDTMQQEIAELHSSIVDTWFALDKAA